MNSSEANGKVIWYKRPWWYFKMWVAGYSKYSSCSLGQHQWDMPGGECIKCGKHDDFFD